MGIYKYKYKIINNACRKNREADNMDVLIEKPSVLESIEESFKQIKDFKEGKIKLKSLEESQELWKKWAKEIEDESK